MKTQKKTFNYCLLMQAFRSETLFIVSAILNNNNDKNKAKPFSHTCYFLCLVQFVAHSNVQQFLGAIWYNGLPGFRRLPVMGQLTAVLKLTCMFPVFSMCYIINSNSEKGQFMKKPFVKFICHCASYMFFLSE